MAQTLPLADVRILDFMWVMAGPASTRILADYGATVIRIESPTRVDTARTLQPFHNNTAGPDSSGLFSNCNAGKFGISLDLGNPRSREVVHDLLQWAEVVTESFSPKAMRAWGYDYESLRKLKPNIIMLSTCLMGQNGPLSRIAGFGNMAAAISGFHNLTGWPDRPPAGPFGAYTDYVSPRSPRWRFWPHSITIGAPDRVNTSTSRRRRPRCISLPRRFSITRPTDASRGGSATRIASTRRTGCIRQPAKIAGSRSCARPMRTGGDCVP